MPQINWQVASSWLISIFPKAVKIVLILLILWLLYRLIKKIIPGFVKASVAKSMKGVLEEEVKQREQTLSKVLIAIATIALIAIALLTILTELGINITAALAGIGIAGIALGLAAQSLVKDIISGFIILIENQYAIGDVIKIGDIAGLVEDMNLRRTILRDLDGTVHIIPHSEIRTVSNLTKGYSRVNLNISVSYNEDLDRVIEITNRVCKELHQDPYWGQFLLNTPQVLRVDNLGDSGIEIKILGDTKPIKQWDVMGEIRRRIKKEFDKEGIEIPWPHTKVYFGDIDKLAKLLKRSEVKYEHTSDKTDK